MTKAANLAALSSGPAFSAYQAAANTTLNHNVFQKVVLNSEVFDTANAFDATTNYRFQPQVAGWYQVNAMVDYAGTIGRVYYFTTIIYKNGSQFAISQNSFTLGNGSSMNVTLPKLIYLNGSTDYLELYARIYDYTASASVNITAGSFMEAALIRAA